MGWRGWKDSLSSLCLPTGQLLPRRRRHRRKVWFACSGSLLFWALLFCCLCPTVSSAFLPLLPHPAAPSFLTCSLLCYSRSQTVQESLSHDCHRFPTDIFPLLLPGKHLLVAWHLYTPLLINKPKYLHCSASTGLILSKTHWSFNMPL